MYQNPKQKQNPWGPGICPFIKDLHPRTHLIEKLEDPLQSMDIDQPVVIFYYFFEKINFNTYLFPTPNNQATG